VALQGLHVYIRELDTAIHKTAPQLARRCLDHHVRGVVILVCWEETLRNVRLLPVYVAALVDAGIEVRFWGYPRAGAEARFVAALRFADEKTGGVCVGLVPDPERPYRQGIADDHGLDATACARKLMQGIVDDAMTERHDLTVTSYGLPRGIPDFPWKEFLRWGASSPQVYNLSPADLRRAYKEYKDHGATEIIPSVQAFGEHDEAKLRPWLDTLLVADPALPGLIVWSWRQISAAEFRTFQGFAEERWP
jgi:hypothetical protein